MKEIIQLQIDRKLLIDILKIAENKNISLSIFISEIIQKELDHSFNNPSQVQQAIESPTGHMHRSFSYKNPLSFNELIQKYEIELIVEALKKTDGVKSKAAELLKMNRTTLVEKIKKLKLE